jgi:putative exporter of polyketide antibiotics
VLPLTGLPAAGSALLALGTGCCGLAFTGIAAVAAQLASAAWTALGLVVVIDLFGPALQLSHWILDISPFTHAPRLPGGPVQAAPLVWLSWPTLSSGIALCIQSPINSECVQVDGHWGRGRAI